MKKINRTKKNYKMMATKGAILTLSIIIPLFVGLIIARFVYDIAVFKIALEVLLWFVGIFALCFVGFSCYEVLKRFFIQDERHAMPYYEVKQRATRPAKIEKVDIPTKEKWYASDEEY